MTAAGLRRLRALPRSVRWIAGAAALVAVLNAAALAGGGRPGGAAAPNSSYSAAPDGLGALADLLGDYGRTVERVRGPLHRARLDPAATLIVADPPAVDGATAAALRRFVSAGGRLVTGGHRPSWIERVVDDPPRWSPDPVATARPIVPLGAGSGPRTVRTAGLGSWSASASALPVLGDDERILVAEAAAGRGTAVFVADLSPLHNRMLDRADNAALGLALAGDRSRPVLFAEGVHGYERATGLAAVPARWRWALAGLALAGAVFMWSRGRRLGPPEAAGRSLPPARRVYADALGSTLARTRRPAEALAPVRARIRELLSVRAGADAGDDDALRAAAGDLGISHEDAAAALGSSDGRAEIVATGRVLATLSRTR